MTGPSPALTIAAVRHLVGLSVAELAGLLDVSPRTVRGWEAGKSMPPDGALQDLARLRNRHELDVTAALAAVDLAERTPAGNAVLAIPSSALPRGWSVAVAARVLARAPHVVPVWPDDGGTARP